jgi:hypothetical protein
MAIRQGSGVTGQYEQLAAAADRPSTTVRDLTGEWEKLSPLSRASGELRDRVAAFADTKRVTLEALEQLDTRLAVTGKGPDISLAWAGWRQTGERRIVTAIKLRHLTTGARKAAPGSTFHEPTIVGNRSSLDWFLAEGETDGARLLDLVGDAAAVMVLPCGALTFKPGWAALIPRGATVYLAHDADDAGDKGAAAAARLIGGRTVRVRPPDRTKDWCDWSGGRDGLVRLVAEAKRRAASRVKTFAELLEEYEAERSQPDHEPVRLGFGSLDADIRGVSAGQLLGVAARTAVGKTWALASIANTFAGRRDAGALILSLEMPGLEWAERALAIHADVSPEQVEGWARQGTLLEHAKPFLERTRHQLLIDEPLALETLPAALADARARLTVPLQLVLVDYLGLLGSTGRDAYERASALGKGLKLAAKDERVAVVVAMQLSRAGADGSKPVSLEMLRDSGVLEESMDFLLGCWRPGKAEGLTPPERFELSDVMRVSILKNRKGLDGRTVDLRFRPESRRLYEPDPMVTV